MLHLRASTQTFYFTLTSMIQSLAFGFLLTSINLTTLPTPTYVLQVITTFLVIVVVWHEYAIGATVVTWVVSLADSLIPFLFGVVEFGLIVALSRKDLGLVWWFTALFVFAIISLAALRNQYRNLSKDDTMKATLELLRPRKWTVYVLISGVSFLLEAVAVHSARTSGWIPVAMVLASGFTLGYFAFKREIRLYPRVMSQLEAADRR
jgi:hypothetical protein